MSREKTLINGRKLKYIGREEMQMTSKVKKITALSLAATMVFTGTAFAKSYDQSKYLIYNNEGTVKVYDQTVPGVPEYTQTKASVTKVGDEFYVEIKDDADVEFTDDKIVSFAVVSGDITNLKTKDITATSEVTYTGTEADWTEVFGVCIFNDETANVETGDITISSSKSMAAGLLTLECGTYKTGDITVKGNGELIGAEMDSEVSDGVFTLNTGDVSATFHEDAADKVLAVGICVGDRTGDENAEIEFTINANGDVYGESAGILLMIGGNDTVNINCLGTISGEAGAIGVTNNASEYTLNVTTWRLYSESGVLLSTNAMSPKPKNNEARLAEVNYILKTDEKNATITLTPVEGETLGTTGDAFEEEYQTQKSGGSVVISVKVKSGYQLNGINAGVDNDGNPIEAVKNADGTWTIIVPEGGGVDITPILKAIAQEEAMPTSKWVNYGDGNWKYVKANGDYAKNEWQLIKNEDGTQSWYHFGADQYMTRGWMTDTSDGYDYYLDPVTGKMAVGVVEIDGKKYHFNENVPTASGWKQDANGVWVYEKRNVIPLGARIG